MPQLQPIPSSSSGDLQVRVSPIVLGTEERNAAIDHLRVGLTALVIFHHVAIAYGGSGGWYWRQEPNASQPLLLMFNATNQAFFMGCFFLLAGYYTPASYDRKGARQFWVDRLLRLGVPLLFYFFVLAPFTVALARTSGGHSLLAGWGEMIRRRAFAPGPLWFAEALLLLAGMYTLWRQFRRAPAAAHELPVISTLAGIALILGGVSFLVRLAIPVGREVLWLQLGYFPCYLFLFAAGCAAASTRVLERITLPQARPGVMIALIAWFTLPVLVLHPIWQGAFEGGWNANALYYAIWDPLVAWGAILGLLYLAGTYWSRPTRLTPWLAASAYAAYIVHPPVAVGLSLAARTWPLSPLVKFALVGAASCVGSFLVGALLRRIPGTRRIL